MNKANTMYPNPFLDTPVATHGFTPRGVLIWENMIQQVINLSSQVNALTTEVNRLKGLPTLVPKQVFQFPRTKNTSTR